MLALTLHQEQNPVNKTTNITLKRWELYLPVQLKANKREQHNNF